MKMRIRAAISQLFRRVGRRTEMYQKKSPFFKLPLELRSEIYMYIFASALIHQPTREPLSDWDRLLLTCRGIKYEMESLPAIPIIALVTANWLDHFPSTPLEVTYTIDDHEQRNLSVAFPSEMYGKHSNSLSLLIPVYISPLFRIFADVITIRSYEHGIPGPTILPLGVYDAIIFEQLMGMAFARVPFVVSAYKEIRRKERNIIPIIPPPCRNYLNTNRVEFFCRSREDKEIWNKWVALGYGRESRVLRNSGKSMTIQVRGRCLLRPCEDGPKPFRLFDGFVWESDTRFQGEKPRFRIQ
jgi:hypothetical protein